MKKINGSGKSSLKWTDIEINQEEDSDENAQWHRGQWLEEFSDSEYLKRISIKK